MKLGIIGSGMIVGELLSFINQLKEIECVHISGTLRSEQKLRMLAQKYGFQRYSTDYQKLFDDQDVDTIYIAVPNHLHYEFARKALEHQKHVIIEKPMTSTYEEAKQLQALATKSQLLIWEAITNQYLPQYAFIQKHLADLGDIKTVSCQFCQYSSRYDQFKNGNILPVFDYKKSGGALMDLNIYQIHFVVGLFGEPTDIQYYPHIEHHVDTSGVLVLYYPDFQCICLGAKDRQASSFNIVQGIKGSICIGSPVSQMKEVRVFKNDGTEITYQTHDHHVMHEEWKAFIEMYQHNDLKKCYEMLEHSVKVSKVQTIARRKAGIFFPADTNYIKK